MRAAKRVLTQLEHGPQTATKLAAATGLTPTRVRKELVLLRGAGRVTQDDEDLTWVLVTQTGDRG